MACLRCGKETENQQVFCPDCHQVMERCPVQPDAPVLLLKRPAVPEERKLPRKVQRPEERESRLRSIVRWLLITVGILTMLVCLLAGLLLNTLLDTPTKPNIGQNYTFVDPAAIGK